MMEAIDFQEVLALVSDSAIQTIPHVVTYPSTRVEILLQTKQASDPFEAGRRVIAQDGGVLGFWKGCGDKLWLDYAHQIGYRAAMLILDQCEPIHKNVIELSQAYAQRALDQIYKHKSLHHVPDLMHDFLTEVSYADPYHDLRRGLRLGLSGMYVLYSMGALTLAESDECTTLAASDVHVSDALRATIRREAMVWPGWRDAVSYGVVYGSLLSVYFGLRLSVLRNASEWVIASLHVAMNTLSYPISTVRRQMTIQRLAQKTTRTPTQTAFESITTLYQEEGWKGFYRGYIVRVLCGKDSFLLYTILTTRIYHLMKRE